MSRVFSRRFPGRLAKMCRRIVGAFVGGARERGREVQLAKHLPGLRVAGCGLQVTKRTVSDPARGGRYLDRQGQGVPEPGQA